VIIIKGNRARLSGNIPIIQQYGTAEKRWRRIGGMFLAAAIRAEHGAYQESALRPGGPCVEALLASKSSLDLILRK